MLLQWSFTVLQIRQKDEILRPSIFWKMAWPHKEDAHAIGRLLAGVYSLEV